ncbi:hypothetical protein WJX79_010085 [Trebouxia sp. C0005]
MEVEGYDGTAQEEWASHLPSFANKANRDLDAYIKRVRQELEYTDVSLEDNEDRIKVMSEHLANVQAELKYTQSRFNAKKNEIQTEDHLKQLSKRQGGRLEKELAASRDVQLELADKLDQLHTDLYRGKEKMDQFKLVMNWNQEEFAQWALAAKQKEEDNMALEQYQRQDEVKMRDISVQLEKLSTAALNKRHDLASEVTETQAAQIELNKTAQDFRQLHAEHEIEIMKNTLNKTDGELSAEMETNGHARQAIEAKRRMLEGLQKKCTAAQAKLEGEYGQLGSLEAKTKELENLRKIEAGRLAAVSKQLKLLKGEQFKKGQQLFGLKGQEQELGSEINGGHAQNRNLSHKLRKLDEKVVTQQEMLYNVNFKLQIMEVQVARAGGTRTDEETKHLNAKIAKLTEVLDGVNAEHAMLTSQVKKAEEDLSHGRMHAAEQRKERESLEELIHSIQLESELTSRALKQTVSAKEERMVEHDVLALEGRRLKGSLVAAAQEIAGLENRKAQLRFSMEERKQEIQMHKETLQAELKMVREDIHRVTLELTESQQRVDKLHAKHDVLVSRNATPDGEVHTQAYYVIKAAQEREELQREGDILDGRIQTAEREVRGLEATLAKLNLVNTDMGKSFRRVDSSEAHAERAVLREQLDRAYDVLKLKRTEERNMVQDVAQAEARLEGLNQEEVQLQSSLQGLVKQKDGLKSQAEEQRQKQARAIRRLEKLQRDLRSKAPVSTEAEALPAEKDIQLGALQDCNTQMLQDLAMFAAGNPLSGVTEQLQAAGVHVPSNSLVSTRSTSSPASSRSGSLSSLSTSRKIAPQRSMRLSTGSIG